MEENVVLNLRMPSCAKIEKVISCKKHGIVAATIMWNNNEITFFRTDFLKIDRVAWYFAEIFSNNDYHEEVPDEVFESIRKNGGFFLSKHFLTAMSDGKVMSREGTAIRNLNFKEAKKLAESIDVPELKSDLMYGVIYDVLGKWLIETETLTKEEWLGSPETESEQQHLLIRDCGGWTVKDILGDIFKMEWTQERYRDYVATREGEPFFDGEGHYPARMRYSYNKEFRNSKAVVRAFMYFK